LPCVYSAGQYEASPCTATADRTCGSCSTTACPSGTYKSASCSTTADRVCSTCSTCGVGRYQTADCTATSNRTCATCATCPAGQYISTQCSGSTNTGCTACGACGANSTRVGCGGASPGSCVCNSDSDQVGLVCYKRAILQYYCPTNYTMSGTQCIGNPVKYCPRYGTCSWGCSTPAGVTVTGQGCSTTGCCKSTSLIRYTCPSGGTPTTVASGSVLCI
jgi:hypothetical protein